MLSWEAISGKLTIHFLLRSYLIVVLDEDKRLAKRRLIEANRARKRAEAEATNSTPSMNNIHSSLTGAPTMFVSPTCMTPQLPELQTTPRDTDHSVTVAPPLVETIGQHLYATEQPWQSFTQSTFEAPNTIYWSRMVAPHPIQQVQSTGFTAVVNTTTPPPYQPLLQPFAAHSFDPVTMKEDPNISILMIPQTAPVVEAKRVCFSLTPQNAQSPTGVANPIQSMSEPSGRLMLPPAPPEPVNSSQLTGPAPVPSRPPEPPVKHQAPIKPIARVQPPNVEYAWTKDDEKMVDSIRQAYREMLLPSEKSKVHADIDDAGTAFRSIPSSSNISTLIEPIIARLVAFAKLVPGFGLVSSKVLLSFSVARCRLYQVSLIDVLQYIRHITKAYCKRMNKEIYPRNSQILKYSDRFEMLSRSNCNFTVYHTIQNYVKTVRTCRPFGLLKCRSRRSETLFILPRKIYSYGYAR